MGQNNLKAAVIGVGSMGKNHARIYHELPNVNLVAVSDTNSERGKKVADEYQCSFYKDYTEMLHAEKLDIVSVCVPTALHHTVAASVMERGLHVMIEKPIATSLTEAEKLLSIAKKKKVILAVGHIERFNPAIKKIKQLIAENQLGKVISLSARRVGLFPPNIKDADVILDLAVHDIDIFSYLIGNQPDTVHASSGNGLIDTAADYAALLLGYGEVNGIIEVNWITPVKIRTLDITGTKGYARLNYITQELTLFKNIYDREYDEYGDFVLKFGEPETEIIRVEKAEPLRLELADFIDSVHSKRAPAVTGLDGLNALRTALKATGANSKKNFFIHLTADVSADAIIGENTKIWNHAQVREGAQIGSDCIISNGVYIDANVRIGDLVKIENKVSVFQGVTIEDKVFIGPHVCFTNDKLPRSVSPDGTKKSGGAEVDGQADWTIGKTRVKEGASIGANSTILPNVTIGTWALVGAGSIVTKDVPDHGLVVGNPARVIGFVCKCGKKLPEGRAQSDYMCDVCKGKL